MKEIERTREAIEVSMPPRRSCFAIALLAMYVQTKSFNATTAFLLPAERVHALLGRSGFQCHHGVPASGRRNPPDCPNS
jgi:hypothetical protein